MTDPLSMDPLPDACERSAIEQAGRLAPTVQALESRLEFENLIRTLAVQFVNCDLDRMDQGLADALGAIGRFIGADRSYLFQFSPDRARVSNTHEWCAEGIAAEQDHLQELPVEAFPWIMPKQLRGEVIVVPDVADLPPEAAAERDEFQREGIQSLLTVPLMLGGGSIGFVGFDAVRTTRAWADDAIALLQIAGSLFAEAMDRKRKDEALRTTQEQLRGILDNAPSIIYVKDREGRHVMVNRHFERLLNRPGDQIVGKTNHELFPPDFADVFRANDRRVLESGVPLTEEEAVSQGDGLHTYLSIKFPLHDAAGTAVGICGISTDITARKRAEQAARDAHAALLDQQRHETERVEAELVKLRESLIRQTRLAAVGQLSASIAHELRNPLGAIRNAVYLVRRRIPAADHRAQEYFGLIEEEIRNCDRIIINLLNMATGKEPEREPVDLSALVSGVCRHVDRPSHVTWRCSFTPTPFVLTADPAQLRQVFYNLFLNAVQALGERGTITVTACREPEADEILVQDDGPGVSPEDRPRLFDPLFTTKTKGTGLGLAICRQIIERHGGMIEWFAPNGPGAAFRIRLPRPPDGSLVGSPVQDEQ